MYLKVRTDPYATREVAAPRSFREPEWKEDLRIAETEDHRDALGPQVIPSNSALPMRQPWLADLGSQVNTALSYGPGSKGFQEDQKPKEVHGVVRAGGSGITPTTDIASLLEAAMGNEKQETKLYNHLADEIGIIASQTGDANATTISQDFASQWINSTDDYSRMQTLTAMADYVTQYFQFYKGSLVGPNKNNEYPTGKGFSTDPVLGPIWTDLEQVRLNGGTAGVTHWQQLALQNITELVVSLANDNQDTQHVMGLPLTLPTDTGNTWSATELGLYLDYIINWDKANGTTYATSIAQLMFDDYNPDKPGENFGLTGSIQATTADGKSINVYGNLFNSSAAAYAGEGGGPHIPKSPWTFQSTMPVTYIQSEGAGTNVQQTTDVSSLQFRVQVANAMTEIILVYWQMTSDWAPTAQESAAFSYEGNNRYLIVTKPDTQPISGYTPAQGTPSGSGGSSPSGGGGKHKPLPPGPTPTWEYVALAAGGGLLAYLIWRQV